MDGNSSAVNADDLVDLWDTGILSASDTFNDLAKLGTESMQYIPWMQASYIMAANRDSLQYLPEGEDIDALTCDWLIEWTANVHEAAGEPKFGFPAGPKGLKHRFFQGYIYPSYTDGVVRRFASGKAVTAWEKSRELWERANPASTNFSFTQEQLLSGDTWIVFDHTSRLTNASNERPDDFVALPGPAGPEGRAFMPVLAGVAIPRTAPDIDASTALFAYLMNPETQIATLSATNSSSVADVTLPDDLPPSVRAAGDAVAKMSASADANPGLSPAGLGEKGGDFNRVYVDTFERIILAGQPIEAVLQDPTIRLEAIMTETGAPCWAPDAPSEGACPVE